MTQDPLRLLDSPDTPPELRELLLHRAPPLPLRTSVRARVFHSLETAVATSVEASEGPSTPDSVPPESATVQGAAAKGTAIQGAAAKGAAVQGAVAKGAVIQGAIAKVAVISSVKGIFLVGAALSAGGVVVALQTPDQAPAERTPNHQAPLEIRIGKPAEPESSDAPTPVALPLPTVSALEESRPPKSLQKPSFNEVARTTGVIEPVKSAGVREEIELLEQARQALLSEPARTLEILEAYSARFPEGQMRADAALLRQRVQRRMETDAKMANEK